MRFNRPRNRKNRAYCFPNMFSAFFTGYSGPLTTQGGSLCSPGSLRSLFFVDKPSEPTHGKNIEYSISPKYDITIHRNLALTRRLTQLRLTLRAVDCGASGGGSRFILRGKRVHTSRLTSCPQYTRVSAGSFPSFSPRDRCICSGVPSKNLPAPPTNSVSPVKTAFWSPSVA